MITLTPQAQEKLLEQCSNRPGTLGIQISIRPTGCSGFAYHLEFVDREPEHARSVPVADTYQIYINEEHVSMLTGVTMHWSTHGLNSGYDFVNPHETARCGCGESFTV